MNAQVVSSPPIRVVMLRHTGPYDLLGPKFEQLWGWVSTNGVPAQRTIGIYWDNPDVTPSHQLRSAACVEVPGGYLVPQTPGSPLEVSELPAGEYATTRYVGPYEGLGPVWTNFTNWIERTLRRRISENPAFEVYVNDASETPPNELITELFMPLA